MKKLLPLVALLALASAAFAQTNQEAAERYARLPGVQKLIDDMFGPGFIEPMLNALGYGNLPADKKAKVVRIIQEELQTVRPAVEAAMISAAAATFSVGELEAMIAFYSTQEGEAILVKQQPYNQAYLGLLGADIQQMQARVMGRILAEVGQ